MYHIQHTVPIIHHKRQSEPACSLQFTSCRSEDEDCQGYKAFNLRSTDTTKAPCPFTEEKHVTWYIDMFGIMTRKQKLKYTKSPRSDIEEKQHLVDEKVWTFRPSFLNCVLQLRYAQSLGHVSRSFNIYPMLSKSNPIFAICESGDLLGLQIALSANSVSPFVTDTNGLTLLHVSFLYGQLLADECGLIILARRILRPFRYLQMAHLGGPERGCYGSFWKVSML